MTEQTETIPYADAKRLHEAAFAEMDKVDGDQPIADYMADPRVTAELDAAEVRHFALPADKAELIDKLNFAFSREVGRQPAIKEQFERGVIADIERLL